MSSRFAWSSYRPVLHCLVKSVLNPGLALLVLPAVPVVFRARQNPLLLGWLLGSTLYVLLFLNLHSNHAYYQLPLVPPLALLAALGIDRAVSRLDPGFRRQLSTTLMAIVILGSSVYTWHRVQVYLTAHADDGHAIAARWIQKNTPTNEFVIYVLDTPTHDWNPAYLYWARRRGYNLIATDVTLARLHEICPGSSGERRASVYFPRSLEPLARELTGDSNELTIAIRADHGVLCRFDPS